MRALEALKTTRNIDAGSEDPRKQMLDEIRKRINAIPSPKSGDDYFDDGFSNAVSKISDIIDEMEAKL